MLRKSIIQATFDDLSQHIFFYTFFKMTINGVQYYNQGIFM